MFTGAFTGYVLILPSDDSVPDGLAFGGLVQASSLVARPVKRLTASRPNLRTCFNHDIDIGRDAELDSASMAVAKDGNWALMKPQHSH